MTRQASPAGRFLCVLDVSRYLRVAAAVLILIPVLQDSAHAAELHPDTLKGFERYMERTEARIREQLAKDDLFLLDAPQQREKLRRGELIMQSVRQGDTDIPHGMVHHWVGAVFIPGATLDKTLAVLQDYDNHYKVYNPEVIASKLLERDGNNFKVFLRLKKKKVLTVVLNTTHDARFFPLDGKRAHSRSYSTRIAEVEDPSRPEGPEKPMGEDHGFLWRLNSWWRFEEKDGGVYVECESVSLTRNIPTGLGWLIRPMVTDLPREALTATLNSTRSALARQTARR